MKSELDAKAWDALKQLGDAALEIGGIQAVLQMFVSVITSAEQVARDSDEAGDPEEMVSEAISTWLVSTYVPSMLEQFSETGSDD
jgi:hypothetical protein